MTGSSSSEILLGALFTDLEYSRSARIPAESGHGERRTRKTWMNFGTTTHPEAMRSLRLFGQEVLPAFR